MPFSCRTRRRALSSFAARLVEFASVDNFKSHWITELRAMMQGDERSIYLLADLEKIPSVINNFHFFAQPKYRIACARPGSGNTKNIGSINKIADLVSGSGPFAKLGEEIYDDYWMYYLTKDMAGAAGVVRPYSNLKTYAEYKQRGIEAIKVNIEEIEGSAEDEGE
jgi:hypothetical protein